MSAVYSFVSWLRQGLGTNISQADNLGIDPLPYTDARAEVSVEVFLNTGDSPQNDFSLAGPGEIINIDPRNIIKVHPERNIGNFEPNYLAFIEFYQDTFLWDYTPAKANGHKLRPWLFLLVLEESEYDFEEGVDKLDNIIINADLNTVFPPISQSWAWGHVHVNASTVNIASLQTQMKSNPDYATSRLISPRRLQPNKKYRACLIPAFESGRQVGLGVLDENSMPPGLEPSWGNGQTEYPVYHHWEFATGQKGDFESLVRELRAIDELDPSIGFQPMDISGPYPSGVNEPVSSQTVGLGGALKPVGVQPPQLSEEPWKVVLADYLNRRDGLQDINYAGSTAGDPVIVPPTYGHLHVLLDKLNKGDSDDTAPIDSQESEWLHTLNLDPANRATAGLGVKVVQESQDEFMAIAWNQIGAVLEANQILKQSQLGIEIALRWWDKQVTEQSPGELVTMVSPLLDVLLCDKLNPPNTENIFNSLQGTTLPTAVLSPAFRNIGKRRGRIARKMRGQTINNQDLVKIGVALAQQNFVDIFNHTEIDFFDQDPNTIQEEWPNQFSLPCIDRNFPKQGQEKVLFHLIKWNREEPNMPFTTTAVPLELEQFYGVWQNFFAEIKDKDVPGITPVPLDLQLIIPCIKTGLNPIKTITDRTLGLIGTEGDLDAIIPIMAAPDYPEPMYKRLLALSTDFMLPNLHKLPNNIITLMEANQSFIEAYMVGLNYEMANELTWNEYPNDGRGSYFRQFWDVSRYVNLDDTPEIDLPEKLKDIDYIHRWVKWTDLGDHRASNQTPVALSDTKPSTVPDFNANAPLVLTIRGDLLNRYPDAIIYAVKAAGNSRTNAKFDNSGSPNMKYPIFSAKIEPDITFLGFELSAEEANGNATDAGWFFCLKEPPSGPRFGLDVEDTATVSSNPSDWNDLQWGNINNSNYLDIDNHNLTNLTIDSLTWKEHSAAMAAILYQVPVMVAIHASQLIPDS